MSTEMEWRKCRHCAKDRYCTPQALVDHEEDCPERPSLRPKTKVCGVCGSVMERVTAVDRTSWICINTSCARTVTLFQGRKQ